MQNLAAGKYAIAVITLTTVGIITGFMNQDPLLVNDFLYNIGMWEYFS